ncbi:MAG: ABC transporter permease subunit, partial [Proteobacteria bacterium]|nr:ABC transporter permease subunit [Pseudomonadota bacterium]
IIFTIFFLLPTIASFVLAFYKWKGVKSPKPRGWGNYEYLFFKDQNFWEIFQNTIFYSAGSVFITIPLALLLALALNNQSLKLKPFWRLVFFSPIVTSVVAAALTFKMILNSEFGLLNYAISFIGIEPINWVESSSTSKWSVMMLVVWRWTGLTCIYFLAGLQFIDRILYEAAKIDGATAWHQFWYVTLPQLAPVTLFVCIIVSIGSFQIFEDVFVMYSGNDVPNHAKSMVVYIMERGFQQLKLGFGSSIGVFMFMFILAISLFQFRSFASNLDQDANKSFIERILSPIIDFIANIFPIKSGQSNKKSLSPIVGKLSLNISITIIGLITLIPYAFMLTSSVKSTAEIMAWPPIIWSKNPNWENVTNLFTEFPANLWIYNSFIVAIAVTILTVFLCTLAGYAFAKYDFKGKKKLFIFMVATAMIPFPIIMIPLYVLVGRMGMNDTLLGLIIPFIAPAIGIFMMRQFITSVPDELIQAARADGAGEFRIFWQIVVPLVWPGIATLSIITYVNSWNSFLWPLIILRDDLNYTIPLGMTQVFALSVGQEPQYGQAMAFATLTTIPIIFIFSFVQKYYIAGLSAGAVKG